MIQMLCILFAISFGWRVLPFLCASWLKKQRFLEKLAETLPVCVLVLLTAHLMQGISIHSYPYALPEMLALISVIVMQYFCKKYLLSMLTGMVLYQLLMSVM